MKTQYFMWRRSSPQKPLNGMRASCSEAPVIYCHGTRQFTIGDIIYLTDKEFKLMKKLKGNRLYLTEELKYVYEK